MSILTEVLEEELDRCRRAKKAYLSHLEDPDLPPKDCERLQASLQRINEDMYRIKRALAPVPPVLPEED